MEGQAVPQQEIKEVQYYVTVLVPVKAEHGIDAEEKAIIALADPNDIPEGLAISVSTVNPHTVLLRFIEGQIESAEVANTLSEHLQFKAA